MFLFNINVFGFKNKVVKHQFLVKRGVATKRFFNEPVFWKMCKVIVFLPIFCQILVDVQKHYKIGISAHFKKQKNKKCILRCYYLGQVGVIIWAKLTAT